MMEFCFGDANKIQLPTSDVYRQFRVTKYVCIGFASAYLELQSTALNTSVLRYGMNSIITCYAGRN